MSNTGLIIQENLAAIIAKLNSLDAKLTEKCEADKTAHLSMIHALSETNAAISKIDTKAKTVAKKPVRSSTVAPQIVGARFPSSSAQWFLSNYKADPENFPKKYLTDENIATIYAGLATMPTFASKNPEKAANDKQRATFATEQMKCKAKAIWTHILKNVSIKQTVQNDYDEEKKTFNDNKQIEATKDLSTN